MPIQLGERAPNIKTSEFKLSDLRGKYVVLFFFPKSGTPGCTREACEFRDSQDRFTRRGAVVAGISPDPAAAQQKFAEKYGFRFRLIPDPDHAISEAYGVWKEKSLYGRKFMGVERSTFIIDPQGKIAHIFPRVKPDGHAEQVLAALAELKTAAASGD